MIVLYTALLIFLILIRLMVQARARWLESGYSAISLAVNQLAELPMPRQGNSNKPDLCQSAKRYYHLGQLVNQRERIERKYFRWQHLADRVDRMVKSIQAWKGRKIPYTMGVVDVSMILYAIDRLGFVQIDLSHLLQTISSMLSR